MSDRKVRAASVDFAAAAKFFTCIAGGTKNEAGERIYTKESVNVSEVKDAKDSPFAEYADASIEMKWKEVSKAMVVAKLPPLPPIVQDGKIHGVRKGSIVDKAASLSALADDLFSMD